MNHGLQNLFNELHFSTSSHPRDHTNERVLQSTIHFYFINNINNTKGKKFSTQEILIFYHSIYRVISPCYGYVNYVYVKDIYFFTKRVIMPVLRYFVIYHIMSHDLRLQQ